MLCPQLGVCRRQAAVPCSQPGFAEDTLGFGHLAATCCRACEKMSLLFLSESQRVPLRVHPLNALCWETAAAPPG